MAQPSSSPSSPSLLIFTTTPSPLPLTYAHPRKPALSLPPLVHRSLHAALDGDVPSFGESGISLIVPRPDSLSKSQVPVYTSRPSSSAAIRGQNGSDGQVTPDTLDAKENPEVLKADSTEYELTVKVHLVAPSSSCARAGWVLDALRALETYKGFTEVETLLVGVKGIDYKGKRSAASEFFGCGAEGMTSDVGPVSSEAVAEYKALWEAVAEKLKAEGKLGETVKTLGGLYLPLEALEELSKSSIPPTVNSLDTPDCHSLPKEYTAFAKEHNIQLWAGGGGEGSGQSMRFRGDIWLGCLS